VKGKSKPSFVIEPWTKGHDTSLFTSNLASIKKYIQEQAHRDTSSHASAVFVLTEPGRKIVRGYYSLSSISIRFAELPEKMQKKLSRYPEASGILLGRLGVDIDFSTKLAEESGIKPRLGEKLLVDAQCRCLASTKEVGSAIMVIDAEMPSSEEIENGVRDPLPFYEQYSFVTLTHSPRRLVKTMRAIAKEFETA
jgi:hypothetical protein